MKTKEEIKEFLKSTREEARKSMAKVSPQAIAAVAMESLLVKDPTTTTTYFTANQACEITLEAIATFLGIDLDE